jgi:hypothetical protein
VLTTVKTSALPIKDIEFPAVTICSQGLNSDIVTAGQLLIFVYFIFFIQIIIIIFFYL